MPETHDMPGRLYWHLQRYPDYADWELPVRKPLFTERAVTNEIEPPFRSGRGRAFRFWPTSWAIVVGRYRKHAFDHETVALERAVEGLLLPTTVAEIEQWPGGAPDEGFEDTPGVIAWVEREAAP